MTAEIPPLHVIVKFGKGIPGAVQGSSLLEFEKTLRRLFPGNYVEVFKEHIGDDSKLRSEMTEEQRARL